MVDTVKDTVVGLGVDKDNVGRWWRGESVLDGVGNECNAIAGLLDGQLFAFALDGINDHTIRKVVAVIGVVHAGMVGQQIKQVQTVLGSEKDVQDAIR